jgi:hypothetical protein
LNCADAALFEINPELSAITEEPPNGVAEQRFVADEQQALIALLCESRQKFIDGSIAGEFGQSGSVHPENLRSDIRRFDCALPRTREDSIDAEFKPFQSFCG